MSEGTVLSFQRKTRKSNGSYRRGFVRGVIAGLGLAAIAVAVFVKPDAEGKSLLPVYYANCKAAHDAGVYSIRRDAPGYRPQLDADEDGFACEPLPAN